MHTVFSVDWENAIEDEAIKFDRWGSPNPPPSDDPKSAHGSRLSRWSEESRPANT